MEVIQRKSEECLEKKMMIRQKSFENKKPTLFLVATPIGNLSEMQLKL